MVASVWKWVIAALLSLWIQFTFAFQLLLCLMGIDFATGILCAIRKGDLSSHVSLRGLMKKTAILIVVCVTYLLQHALRRLGGITLLIDLAQTVALAYCWHELVSILENCSCMGAPIPDVLHKLLAIAPKIRRLDPEEESFPE